MAMAAAARSALRTASARSSSKALSVPAASFPPTPSLPTIPFRFSSKRSCSSKKIADVVEELANVLNEAPTTEATFAKARPLAKQLIRILCSEAPAESYRCFPAVGREPAEEAQNGLHMWWQRCMYRIKNADIEQRTKFVFWYSVTVLGVSTFYTTKTMRAIRSIQ